MCIKVELVFKISFISYTHFLHQRGSAVFFCPEVNGYRHWGWANFLFCDERTGAVGWDS